MKANYVRKYDYLQYFYRPKSEWFIDDEIINDILHEKIKILSAKSKNTVADLDEEDEEDETFGSKENDSYEFYLMQKENLSPSKKLDLTNPKVCEGQIIDQKSREFIKRQFPKCKSIDLSEQKLTNEQTFARTLELIKENDNIVLFQSVFIYTDKKDNTQKAIAKPDAIVKVDNKLILIETKGTTSTKLYHLMDIYYQKNIINESLKILENEPQINEYKLCIVKYEKCAVHEVSFVLVDRCNFNKGPKNPSDNQLKEAITEREVEELKQYTKEIIDEEYDYSIDSLLNKGESISLSSRAYKPYVKKFNEYFSDENKFWKIIDELFEYKPIDPERLTFEPCKQYKSDIKDTDYWLLLRDYYYFSNNPKLFPFQFSGKLIPYAKGLYLYEKTKEVELTFDSYLNEACKDIPKPYNPRTSLLLYSAYIKPNSSFISNGYCFWKESAHKAVNSLRDKKVYFDFESLNSAIRVVDGYYPFMQTVNQVSIIFDHGNKKLSEPIAIVIDPKKGITKQDFKEIIDAILPSKNLEECKEYHYVVFNDGFEVPRLNEMAKYINEKEYFEKVEIITSNIFDIAEWFTIHSDPKKDGFVVFKDLRGFYSIKKVLPLVEKYKPEIFKLTGCKNYKTELTKIQNGSDAQNASTRRFFNIETDEEWEEDVKHLKEYCNNDVRAMIAVEYLVKEIMKEHYDL